MEQTLVSFILLTVESTLAMATFFETLNELMVEEVPLVTITVVDTSGSVPQDRGAKAIVTAEGLRFGTVGGGRIETKAIAEAQRILRGEHSENTMFATWSLNKEVGMTCGGVVKLYFEAFNARRWRIVIFGAGHVANALTTLLVHFDAQITCIDPREEWLARLPKSPKLTSVLADDMPSLVSTLPDDAFVVLMTMGHTTDRPILLEILRTRQFPYLGVIGSDSKAAVLRRDVAAAGLSEEMQRSFHCPIGLEIGTNHPYEIAVSVIAQLIQRRDERTRALAETSS